MTHSRMLLILAAVLAAFAAACSPLSPTASPSAPASEPRATALAEPVTLNVFAAASLTAAFGEIGRAFESDHPGATVVFNFGGSNQLAEQINQGAPVDVFASANSRQMQVVIDSGRVLDGAAQTFVRNRLVVIVPSDNPAGITTLHDLTRPGLKLVLAAAQVPVGQYSLDFLELAGGDIAFGVQFKDQVLKNVVSYEENVKAVFSKVALGEADAGIVYTSDVTGDDAARVVQLAIPDDLNTIATYPIAPIHDSAQPDLARAFVEYVLSPAGQEGLSRFGFLPAVPSPR
jgi:molybdate transport system substrate-binding protein